MSASHHRPNRRSLRYPGYDYASAGAYFVTFCVLDGEPLLGCIIDHEIHLSGAGKAIGEVWYGLPTRFPGIELDAFQIMPNHVHLIVWLGQGETTVRPQLGEVIRVLKSLSAIGVNGSLGRSGRVWQRGYWDRIVRDEDELARIRDYVRGNPARWVGDRLNPAAGPNRFNQGWRR